MTARRRKHHEAVEDSVPAPVDADRDGSGPQPAEAEAAAAEHETPPAEDRPDGGEGGTALVEPEQEAVVRLTEERDEWKDRALRAAAELDNYRKRVLRERDEVRQQAQAQLVGSMIDALDDLARIVAQDAGTVGPKDLHAGVELVERKLVRDLRTAGLSRLGTAGEPFDPHDHEAVATLPAETPDQVNTLAAVFQTGYRFGKTLIRPARVQVYVESEDHAAE